MTDRPNNFDGATGKWDIYDENDPACTAANDQLLARAHEVISGEGSFILISIPRDDSNYVYDCASAVKNRDKPDLMKALCDFLIRLWFEETPHGSVVEAMAALQLTYNVSHAIDRYMEKGGEL